MSMPAPIPSSDEVRRLIAKGIRSRTSLTGISRRTTGAAL
jgi:hypothetical protein